MVSEDLTYPIEVIVATSIVEASHLSMRSARLRETGEAVSTVKGRD